MVRAWLIVPLSIAGSATSPTSPEAPGVVSALLQRKREPAARAAAGRVRVAARRSMFCGSAGAARWHLAYTMEPKKRKRQS